MVVVERETPEKKLLSIEIIRQAPEALKGGSQGEKNTPVSHCLHSLHLLVPPVVWTHLEARGLGSLLTWSMGCRVQKDGSDVKEHGHSRGQGLWLVENSYTKSNDLGR